MSSWKDKEGLGKNLDQDKPYAVGHKKPPRQFQFKPGQSGNPKGRPKGSKDLAKFGEILAGEFNKKVTVSLAGKTVNKTQGEILAQVMMKNAITTKKSSHVALLLKFMEAHETRLAALEAMKIKQASEGAVEIDWDEEKERVYQELMARAGKIVKDSCTNLVRT